MRITEESQSKQYAVEGLEINSGFKWQWNLSPRLKERRPVISRTKDICWRGLENDCQTEKNPGMKPIKQINLTAKWRHLVPEEY